MPQDQVNHPSHYASQGKIECIEVLEQLAQDGEDFCILNALKYLWRWRHKNGVQDLEKAVWYIQRVINRHKPKEAPHKPKEASAPFSGAPFSGGPFLQDVPRLWSVTDKNKNPKNPSVDSTEPPVQP